MRRIQRRWLSWRRSMELTGIALRRSRLFAFCAAYVSSTVPKSSRRMPSDLSIEEHDGRYALFRRLPRRSAGTAKSAFRFARLQRHRPLTFLPKRWRFQISVRKADINHHSCSIPSPPITAPRLAIYFLLIEQVGLLFSENPSIAEFETACSAAPLDLHSFRIARSG